MLGKNVCVCVLPCRDIRKSSEKEARIRLTSMEDVLGNRESHNEPHYTIIWGNSGMRWAVFFGRTACSYVSCSCINYDGALQTPTTGARCPTLFPLYKNRSSGIALLPPSPRMLPNFCSSLFFYSFLLPSRSVLCGHSTRRSKRVLVVARSKNDSCVYRTRSSGRHFRLYHLNITSIAIS